MISAIIVDDEEKNVWVLNKIIESYCDNVEVLGTAQNIVEAKKLIDELKPQLVFLDIEMPNGSGFELLSAMDNIDFEIIFVTAYNQYAIDAFKYASIDYLLKPININQLKLAIQKTEQRITEKQAVINYKALLLELNNNDLQQQRILLIGSDEKSFVKINEILYCLAKRSYTVVYITNNRKFISSKNLRHFEETLPESIFCRIHHGSLVNKHHVQSISKGLGGSVRMTDGKELEIAVRRRAAFLKML